MALIDVKSNKEIDERKRAEEEFEARIKAEVEQEATVIETSLASYVRRLWERARRAKATRIEPTMFENLRQFLSQYSPDKLKQIREVGGSDAFLEITETKCKHAIYWLREALFQPSVKPWGVEPTPVPELPPNLASEINQVFIRKVLSNLIGVADIESAISAVRENLTKLHDEVRAEIRRKAKSKIMDLEYAIDDILVQGGWYEALHEAIVDMVVLNNMFIKGPIQRYRMRRKLINDPDTGELRVGVVKELCYEFERRSPFDIYPEPDSVSIDDGYLFDHVSYRRKDLMAMIGVPGFRDDEIRAVLREHTTGGLRDWTGIEAERAELERRETTSVIESDTIDALEFYGTIPGQTLLDAGVEGIDDPDLDYHVVVILIGKHVIKAVLNDDPLGRKPFYTTSYEVIPGSFWGRGLPETIRAPQAICNAAVRALVNNIGMASGPQVEIDVDRISRKDQVDFTLKPWKKWLTTSRAGTQAGNAIKFWQPQMYAESIINVLNAFSKVIDNHCGVPGYAHGDVMVGGAGKTASGLSMLMTQAGRGIRGAIRNVDNYIIKPCIERVFEIVMSDPKYFDVVGDVRIRAKGSQAFIEKEQKAVRMLELLAQTNNPLDLSITGIEGRAYLLEEVAKTYEIDKSKFLAGREQSGQEASPPTAMEIVGKTAKPKVLSSAGTSPVGEESRLFEERGGRVAIPRQRMPIEAEE